MKPIIKIENLSKQYRLGVVGTGTLSNDLKRWWYRTRGKEDPFLKIGDTNDRSTKGESNYVWALKDINLEVMPGEVLGIIGKNGAGKSTLLKILSKVTGPTTGSISFNGRIGSLLEVGTGFHPELTGRENIFLNGAILGMTKTEIRGKLDEIVDFSGVERYLDTPVKRYSSGMMVRLGFAVAAHLEPEILVVDEVLAVGDAEFQKKAIGKMQDVSKNEGRTVLFVSHNMASVKTICNKGVVLKNGSIDYYGDTGDAINFYLKDQSFEKSEILDSIEYHTNIVLLESITINGKSSNIVQLTNEKTELNIEIEGSLLSNSRIELEAELYDKNGILLASYCPGHVQGIYKMYNKGRFALKNVIKLPSNITKGEFFLKLYLTDPNVTFIVTTQKPIKIISEGLAGDMGMSFDYQARGMLMLKDNS